jgi:hypothetical protein
VSEERLGAEVQIAKQPKHQPGDDAKDMFDDAVDASRLTPEMMELIERMLAGTEPYGRDLKSYEVVKFTPYHVNVCTLRAAGFKGVEISQIVGADQSSISIILRHPYGVKLVAALVPRSTVKIFDIRTKLEEYASTLLDETYKAALTCEDLEVQSRVTFGLLDRAGYQPRPAGGEGKAPPRQIEEPTLRRLTAAIEESDQVNREVMPGFIPRRPPEEGALPAGDVVGSSGEMPQVAELGQPVRAAGGSK